MLSEKPWKSEATVRLLMGALSCIYAGSVLVSAVSYAARPGKVNGWVFGGTACAALGCLGVVLYLVSKPIELESLRRRMIQLLVSFYGALLAGAFVHRWAGEPGASVNQMIVAAVSFQGAVLVLVMRYVREHNVGWNEAFGLAHCWRHALLAGLLATFLFLPVAWGLQQGSAFLLTRLSAPGVQPEEQQAVQVLRVAVSWVDRAVLGVVTIVLAPVAEELLFRGIFYPWIKQAGFPRLALWGTSLAFAVMHLNLISLVPLLVLALGWTWLYERTNNLLAPIVAHGLFNGMNFTLLYLVDSRMG